MMLYTRNYGMLVLVPLSHFLVRGSEFITFPKVIWNRYFEVLQLVILLVDSIWVFWIMCDGA